MRQHFPAEHTLPVWSVTPEGMCSCPVPECKRPGKHPHPNADGPGYAVITGKESGIIVFDPDVKGGIDGITQLENLENIPTLGPLPTTLVIQTPSGGMHFYFRHPGGGDISNAKLDTAIDVRADGELVYVVGPGSPGYVKTEDPCVVVPAEPYTVITANPIAELPESWVSYLRQMAERRVMKAESQVDPIDESHEDWQYRIDLFVKDCLEYPASQEGGTASHRMTSLARRGAVYYALPIETCVEIMEEHWNPRCTQLDGVTPYPWDSYKLEEALINTTKREGARDGQMVTRKVKADIEKLGERMQKPAAAVTSMVHVSEEQGTGVTGVPGVPGVPMGLSRRVHSPGHHYRYQIGRMAAHSNPTAVNLNDIISLFTSHKEWDGCWQYDEFADHVICIDPPIRLDAESKGISPVDLTVLRSYLEHRGYLMKENEVQKAVTAAAIARKFHPVQEYLSSLPDGDPAIFEGLAKHLFGTDEPLADEFLRKFLVSSVRRSLNPGCQVDTMLVLYGPMQGEGKTSFVKALFEERWTRTGLPADLGNRDASHALLGYRCVELGELASLIKTHHNTAKDFLSRTEDTYRQYGNGERICRKRECVFIGTTNDDDFLRDATGNRRYWVVKAERGHTIPLDWVREHRDALWAAAVTLAKDTFRHWFTPEEEQGRVQETRQEFIEADAWDEEVRKYCTGRQKVKASDVWQSLGGEKKDFDRGKLLRIVNTLKRLGCVARVTRNGKFTSKDWYIPEDLSSAVPEAKELAARVREEKAEAAKKN